MELRLREARPGGTRVWIVVENANDCVRATADSIQVEALGELAYDLVLTDWHMPGGGGRAVLDELIAHYPETARVVHASHLDSGDTLRSCPAHVAIAKPATESEILTAIDYALRRAASEAVRAAR